MSVRERLSTVLRLLRGYGLECSVSYGELLTYLNAPSYEDDRVTVDEVLANELLLLHEVAEICILKKWGYRITRSIIMEAYPDTYSAHLKALEIELEEARKRGMDTWVKRRCNDLTSYLEDPYLPPDLKSPVRNLISRYCGGVM